MNGAFMWSKDPDEARVQKFLHWLAIQITYRYILEWARPNPYEDWVDIGGEG